MIIKMWEKSELSFALLWIAVYVMGNSLAAGLSDALGIKHCVTAVFNLGVGLFLWLWIGRHALAARYGLCGAQAPGRRFLWYLPLLILVSKNLWNGVALPLPMADTLFTVCNMVGVGFLEELLFRGFLFRAVSRDSVKRGVVISSVTFGLGHMVNLINGRGMELAENLWQITFAVAFGFLCAILLLRGGSLWPCILTHAGFNIADVFTREAELTAPVRILQNVAALALMAGYTWILVKTPPEK